MIQNMHITKQSITKGPKTISKWLQYPFIEELRIYLTSSQLCSTKFGNVLNVSILSPEIPTTMHNLLI